VSSAVVTLARPASADTIASEQAQAAAITAKIQQTQGQIQVLSGQVQAADFKLSQLDSEIAANQAAVTRDQSTVSKDTSQLRVQAISDYTDSGTTNQITDMFSGNVNTSGIRSEYSSIATGNVTTTIDRLHTAQSALEVTQGALRKQQTAATATRDALSSEENQASALVAQDQSTLNSVNANIQALVKQQQEAAAAAAAAAAQRAFNAKVAASKAAQAAAAAQAAQQTATDTGTSGGGTSTSTGTSSGGGSTNPVAADPPPVPAGAAGAIEAAESQIGVPYVWGGETPGVGFDCSGLVQWSWAQAGVSLPRTSGAQYEATTHIPLADIEPGDLLFYGPDGADHVAMYIGGGEMIEAPETGQSVHITGVRTGDDFAGVGRVE
jgi:cell wall-associated NlpC family hydrolase